MREIYGAWAVGAAMVVLSILGVLMASAAKDPVFHATGLAFSLFGILFVFGLIARHAGRE